VHGAANAAQAHEAVRRVGDVDILLTDLILGPGTNGVQLAKALHTDNPKMRHIFMTGYADETLRSELEDESSPVLLKPFRLASLKAALAEVLSQ